MSKILEGFPESVVALSALGRVTRKNYDDAVMPRINAALRRHGKVRLYYELASSMHLDI
jgi:hypothetical protein